MSRPVCICGMKMEYAKVPKSWGCDHGCHGFNGTLQGPCDDPYGIKVRAQIKAWIMKATATEKAPALRCGTCGTIRRSNMLAPARTRMAATKTEVPMTEADALRCAADLEG